jgi:hypothetical protein
MGFTHWHWHFPFVFGWIGIFLLCLGGMIYLLSKADAESKRVRREEKEKK